MKAVSSRVKNNLYCKLEISFFDIFYSKSTAVKFGTHYTDSLLHVTCKWEGRPNVHLETAHSAHCPIDDASDLYLPIPQTHLTCRDCRVRFHLHFRFRFVFSESGCVRQYFPKVLNMLDTQPFSACEFTSFSH